MAAQNTQSTLSDLEFYPTGNGFVIYEYQREGYGRGEIQHLQCEEAKPWDWPRYKGGACLRCEEMFRGNWTAYVTRLKDGIDGYMKDVGIGKRHAACMIDGYEGPENVRKACNEIARNPADLVLCGPPGTGKTHLAAAIVRTLILTGKIFTVLNPDRSKAIFITAPNLFLELRKSFNDRDADTEAEVIERLSTIPLLILDDLGSEKPTEWAITTLYTIIDARYREMKPTIVTTNLSLQQIATQLHDRIASRLSSGKVIKLKGSDRRAQRDTQTEKGGSTT